MKHGILETAILPLAWEKETISNCPSWLAHLSTWNSVSMVSHSRNTWMKPAAVKSLSVSVSGRRIPEVYVMFSWASEKKSLSGQHLYYVHINSEGHNRTKIPSEILAVESRCSCLGNFSLSNRIFCLWLEESKVVKTSFYLQVAEKPNLKPVILCSRYLQWMGKWALCDFWWSILPF